MEAIVTSELDLTQLTALVAKLQEQNVLLLEKLNNIDMLFQNLCFVFIVILVAKFLWFFFHDCLFSNA